MGKRKQTVPQKATEEKRKCLTWNMLENQSATSSKEPELILIDDNDPTLAKEFEEAENKRKKQRHLVTTETGGKESFHANDDIWEIFSLHLENCVFHIGILRQPKLKPSEWSCDFGEFQITFLPELCVIPVPKSLPELGECWLYVGIQRDKSLLYYEVPDDDEEEETSQKFKRKKVQEKKRILYWNVDIPLSLECMEALKCNVFQIVIDNYNFNTLTVDLKIIATEATVSNLAFPSEAVRPKKQNHAISTLMAHFYKAQVPTYEDMKYNKKHDIDELYREIKQRHDEENRVVLPDIQHPSFKPQLRLYQQQAITWMVRKEKQGQLDRDPADHLHMLFTEITTRDNKRLYYNRHGGLLVQKQPHPSQIPPAGILGDEMGLGKTVEVLGCMLNNPRTDVAKPEKLPVIVDAVRNEGGKKGKKKEKKPKRKKGKKVDRNPKPYEEEPDSNTGSTIIYSHEMANEDKIQLDKSSKDQVTVQKCMTVSDDPVPSTSTAGQCNSSVTDFDKSEENHNNLPESSEEERTTLEQGSGNLVVRDINKDVNACETDRKEMPENVEETPNNAVSADSLGKDIAADQSGEKDIKRFESLETEEDDQIGAQTNVVEKNDKSSVVGRLETVKSETFDKVEDFSKGHIISNDEDIENKKLKDIEIKENVDSFDEVKGLNIDDVKGKVSADGKSDKESKNVMKRKRSEIDLNSAVGSQRPQKNIFTEMPASQRECFECVCGATEAAATKGDARKHPVQCVECSLWQHAECVNYDLKDVYRGPFKCPHCHVSSPPVVSGATLIISPASIAHQWVEEILKHIVQESLNVFMYTGVNKQGFIQPQTLAQQDIVITTYETLRKEIDYVDLPHNNSSTGRKLRHPKRFMAIPSPITSVEWWRICLDEAQMVECTTTKTAEMALKLSAVNRWCVTGTPIQKGVEDLYGLLLFLGIDPFWVQQWWNKLIYEPFCYGIKKPMHDLLTSVLWRTVKKDVLDQINIPKQTEHIHWLTFSPVEDHFYRRQYKECSKLAMERLGKFTERSTRLSKLDRHTINQLLYPLLRLRQACCHPQAVRGEFLPIHKSTMTMEQLLESLTKKAKLEAEESHRALVASINGQAGLDIINKQFADAVEKYREVLRSVEEHKEQLHTDSLQQLHAMFNLQEILSSKPQGVDPTLRDELLLSQITELRDRYMAKAIAYVTGTREALVPVQLDVKSLQQQLTDNSEWWFDVIEWVIERDQQEVLIEKVRDDLLDNRDQELNSVARR